MTLGSLACGGERCDDIVPAMRRRLAEEAGGPLHDGEFVCAAVGRALAAAGGPGSASGAGPPTVGSHLSKKKKGRTFDSRKPLKQQEKGEKEKGSESDRLATASARSAIRSHGSEARPRPAGATDRETAGKIRRDGD